MKFNFTVAVLLIYNKILFNDQNFQEKRSFSRECNDICINMYIKNIYNLFLLRNNNYLCFHNVFSDITISNIEIIIFIMINFNIKNSCKQFGFDLC